MYHPYYQHPYTYQPYSRSFPAVDTTTFTQSVGKVEFLLQQSQLLMKHLENQHFSYQLMDAAQKSNQQVVDHLIQSIPGLTVLPQTHYSPTGVVFQVQSPDVSNEVNCCHLSIVLKWA
ncbi:MULTISPECIES: hypothetical protein [Shouchella]|uniref:Uncharacterized protein n=1 Tax=Shouchella hunanensis TaxID=766894 RepID=A0ABY7W6I7_9BACI|nr:MULTISPECIES: hypothetical protein [Shouchella]WDF04567.1 hypothetical protein PQ477_03620 [Shouchella hunanensis]GAF24384.1 hypothetical protein JCM19047_4273 [Bacillus sp. JCM 19047]